MMNDICDKFLSVIDRKFGFLFNKKGFKVLKQEPAKGEFCTIFLGSSSFKIKIYRAPDEIRVLIGSLSAPLIWGEKSNGRTHWHHLTNLANYLENKSEVVIPSLDEWKHETLKKQINEQSKLLRKHYRSIENLFGKGEFGKHKREYEQFIELRKRKAQEAYEKLANRGKGQ